MYVIKIATIIPNLPLLADNHLTRLNHICLGFAVHVSVAPFTWPGYIFEAGSDFGQIGLAVSAAVNGRCPELRSSKINKYNNYYQY